MANNKNSVLGEITEEEKNIMLEALFKARERAAKQASRKAEFLAKREETKGLTQWEHRDGYVLHTSGKVRLFKVGAVPTVRKDGTPSRKNLYRVEILRGSWTMVHEGVKGYGPSCSVGVRSAKAAGLDLSGAPLVPTIASLKINRDERAKAAGFNNYNHMVAVARGQKRAPKGTTQKMAQELREKLAGNNANNRVAA